MKVKLLFMALALLSIGACQNSPDKKTAASTEEPKSSEMPPVAPAQQPNDHNNTVLGKWQATEWLLAGKPSGEDASKLHFEFMNDGTFKANYGDQHKNGTWRSYRDTLYTTQAGKKELPMKLLKSDGNVLELEMDVKGKPEVFKLRKE